MIFSKKSTEIDENDPLILEKVRENLLKKGYIQEQFNDYKNENAYRLTSKFYEMVDFDTFQQAEKNFLILMGVLESITLIDKLWERENDVKNMDIMLMLGQTFRAMSMLGDVPFFIHHMLKNKGTE